MGKHNPFNMNKHDLGTDLFGYTADEVTQDLKHYAHTHDPKCYVCTVSGPQYRVLPKKPQYDTAELQNGVYICRHCLSLGTLDPDRHALRELK